MPRKQNAAIRAVAVLREHSRACRSLETREFLVTVERRLIQLIDLERAQALRAASLRLDPVERIAAE